MIATETKTEPPVFGHPLLSGLERGSPPTGTIWAHIGPIMGPIGRFGAHVWPRGPLFGRFMGPQGPMAHGPIGATWAPMGPYIYTAIMAHDNRNGLVYMHVLHESSKRPHRRLFSLCVWVLVCVVVFLCWVHV